MKCIICRYDDDLRPPPGGEPREATCVVYGMSTCDQHLGEALCGDLSAALRSIKTQVQMRATGAVPRYPGSP